MKKLTIIQTKIIVNQYIGESKKLFLITTIYFNWKESLNI